jgi:hypothetical protein
MVVIGHQAVGQQMDDVRGDQVLTEKPQEEGVVVSLQEDILAVVPAVEDVVVRAAAT